MLKYLDPVNNSEINAASDIWKAPNGEPYCLPINDKALKPELIDVNEFSLWRYRHALPLDVSDNTWRKVTLGEGGTALVHHHDLPNDLMLKIDFAMPTLSFKDRGVAVMMAQAYDWGVEHVVVDSSGNAATSVAAYAARLGMAASVFVPASTSDGKLSQIAAHGAQIHKVKGSREDTADATHDFLVASDAFYASHVYNPLFHQGTKTMIYEIWEQLSGQLPKTMILPVGNGTMLIGAIIGIQELFSVGLIKDLPHIIAVQSVACAPLLNAYTNKLSSAENVDTSNTIAEGIAIAKPARGSEILRRVHTIGGEIVGVSDQEVNTARRALASAGFYVEPTSAVCFAAYTKLLYSKPDELESCLVPLCGAGLKSSKS